MLLHLGFCNEWFESNSKWIQNLLEDGFEKLEKEKEKGNFLLRVAFFRSPARGPPSPLPRPRLRFLGPSSTTASRPIFACAAASRTESLRCWFQPSVTASLSFLLPSVLSNREHAFLSLSDLGESNPHQISLLSLFTDAYGL
jgi:hypothetical protein